MSKKIVGAILTGGKSSRMNYINKSFLNINNKDFIEIIINTLSKRLEKIYINANQDLEKYQKFNRPIVSDLIKGFKGPLAGLHSIMKQFENDKSDIWFALVPTDAPFIPIEYINNFIEKPHVNNSVCISRINNKIEPMFSFWSIKTLEIIEKELIKSDGVKIMKIAEDLKYDIIDFKTVNEIEFMNINTNEDYLKIKSLSIESD
ncbi:molybdenum cofactor guanylyltransferase [Alphaproteobacteria bacterium]|nr:molybdenum cofactor guanylyltransferase [Alphaproteobacteria bacterium]